MLGCFATRKKGEVVFFSKNAKANPYNHLEFLWFDYPNDFKAAKTKIFQNCAPTNSKILFLFEDCCII